MARAYDEMGRVREGMEVYGSDGAKLGTVGGVYHGVDIRGAAVLEPDERSYFEVKRGVLGLGEPMRLEADDIREVHADRVILRRTGEEAGGATTA